MPEVEFKEYAQKLTAGIRNKAERVEVEEELFSHLMDAYETNVAVGMTHSEAVKDATEKLGTPEKLHERLLKLHEKAPLQWEINGSLGLLCLLFITTNFCWMGYEFHINNFLSIFLMLLPLIRLRKVNKLFSISCFLCTAFFFSLLGMRLYEVGTMIPEQYYYFKGVIEHTFLGILWVLIILATDRFSGKNNKFNSSSIFSAVFIVVQFALGAFMFTSTRQWSEDMLGMVSVYNFAPILLPLKYIIVYNCLYNPSRILIQYNGNYNIEPLGKKFAAKVLAVIAFTLVSFLSVNYICAVEEPAKTEWITNDVSAEYAAEVAETKEEMLSWGVTEEVLNDLPDSEILNYSKAESCKYYISKGYMYSDESTESIIEQYFFLIPEKNQQTGYYVRALFISSFNYGKEKPQLYRAKLDVDSGNFSSPYIESDFINEEVFYAVLTQKDGKAYSSKPFYVNIDSEELIATYRGLEYREQENQKVYYALNLVANTSMFDYNYNWETNEFETESFNFEEKYTFVDSVKAERMTHFIFTDNPISYWKDTDWSLEQLIPTCYVWCEHYDRWS